MNGVPPLFEEGGNYKKQSFDQKGPFVKKCKNRTDSEQVVRWSLETVPVVKL